jgi:hypothetical protein
MDETVAKTLKRERVYAAARTNQWNHSSAGF